MNESINIYVTVLVVCYFIYGVFRLILNKKIDKRAREYEAELAEKMNQMQADIEARSMDLKESMQMINQEYHHVMKTLQKQQFHEAKNLRDALAKYQEDQQQSTDSDSTSASEPNDQPN